MLLPLAQPPRSVCILRLSALGDTCHVVPIIRTLQHAWPATQLTWIIGKAEARLMSLVDGVEFITVDKRAGFERVRSAGTAARPAVRCPASPATCSAGESGRRTVSATVKLGFDRARARDLQWLFTNARVAARTREHVLDSFFGFLAALGIKDRLVGWNIPLPENARAYADRLIPDAQPTLIISPCSSHVLRNWPASATPRSPTRRRPARHAGHSSPVAAARWRRRRRRDRTACPARSSTRSAGHACRNCWRCSAGPRAGHPGLRSRPHGDDGRHAGVRLYAATNPARSASIFHALVRRCLSGSRARFRGRARRAPLDPQDRGARRDGPHRGRPGHREAR